MSFRISRQILCRGILVLLLPVCVRSNILDMVFNRYNVLSNGMVSRGYNRRQYVPPTTTRGSVFNFDQSSSFDLSGSGYLLTLGLLGGLGAAAFAFLALSSQTSSSRRSSDNFNALRILDILENTK